MSVSDQLFVSHFPIPQGLRVMISQILLTCLSSRIGRTHYLKCTSSGHCNHFCPVCQFSVDDADDPYLATTINDLAPILTSPKRRPVSWGSIGSELRLLKSLILRTKPKNEKGCVILSEICFIAGTMLVLSHDFGMKIQIYLV